MPKSTGTLIITPQKTYDLEDDSDELTIGIKSFVSKEEYKLIKKRMQEGKINGVKRGMWTSGQPPFPYIYDRLRRELRVDETNKFYYREMVKRYIEGQSLTDITEWLSANIPRQRHGTMGLKKKWSITVVRRILTNEVHLGYIIFGRYKNKRGKRKVAPKEEWIMAQGNHEVLKSQEEHKIILERLATNSKLSVCRKGGTLPLSGLLYCEKCGALMTIKTVEYKNGDVAWSATCSKRYLQGGERCSQKSSILNETFFHGLYQRVIQIDENMQSQLIQNDQEIIRSEQLLSIKRKELDKNKQAIERLYEMREEGDIIKEVFVERKQLRDVQGEKLEAEIDKFKHEIEKRKNVPSIEEIRRRIKAFRERWVKIESTKERNALLKKIVKKITYNRIENELYLGICYE